VGAGDDGGVCVDIIGATHDGAGRNLLPHLGRRDQANAVGLTNRRRAVAVEAADIRAALHRRRQGMTPHPYSVESNVVTHQGDLAGELRWLTQVSHALARHELRRTPS
jgi:hypothetical protein